MDTNETWTRILSSLADAGEFSIRAEGRREPMRPMFADKIEVPHKQGNHMGKFSSFLEYPKVQRGKRRVKSRIERLVRWAWQVYCQGSTKTHFAIGDGPSEFRPAGARISRGHRIAIWPRTSSWFKRATNELAPDANS